MGRVFELNSGLELRARAVDWARTSASDDDLAEVDRDAGSEAGGLPVVAADQANHVQ
jgi:hypothetical protein